MKHRRTIHEERDGAFTRQSLRSGATKKAKRRRNKEIRREWLIEQKLDGSLHHVVPEGIMLHNRNLAYNPVREAIDFVKYNGSRSLLP